VVYPDRHFEVDCPPVIVALRDPDSVGLATQVLAIPIKRCDKPLVGYLTQPEMEAILAVTRSLLWIRQRDHDMLLTMYNSGGRVSEITGLSGVPKAGSKQPFRIQ
jgi:integrase/recombinase XerD